MSAKAKYHSMTFLPVGTRVRLRGVKGDTRRWQITRINETAPGRSDGYLIRRQFVGTASFLVPYKAMSELFEVVP